MIFRDVTAALVLALATSSAQAACKDDIDKLEAQHRAQAKSSIATASGGQAEAAKREAPQHDQSKGSQAMRAQVALNDAKVALSKGDETACEAAVAKAREP